MKTPEQAIGRRFRVWIARYGRQPPSGGGQAHCDAVALEPAEEEAMSAAEAAAYVETFNRIAIEGGRQIRAVARPVALRYDGDFRPGQRLDTP